MNKNWIDERYEILEKLGSGGMGEVYKVLDKVTQTTLALKISFPNLKEKNYLTFKKEFQTLASLSHPNILKTYDFGTIEDRRHYFTMEYIDGKDIYELFKSFSISRKPQYQLLYSIIYQICEALRFIHFRGLIHGDVKPNNIMIENGSSIAKLMDFGLVEEINLSKASKLRGTLNYIAPELLAGEKVEKRADFFSLGVTLYQILTHKMPFKGENPISLLKEYKGKRLIPPQKLNQAIPIELNNLVLKLLEVDPQKRFENVDETQKALSKIFRRILRTAKENKPYLFKSHFIGREKEFDTLKKRYREVVNRNGRAILILAENGTGKTRLAQEFKVYTELEGATFREISFSSQKGKGIQPFANLFIEEKHQKRTETKDGLALFEEIINLFIDKAKRKPVFLLIEDIQLSDKSSINFMKYLIRSIEKIPVLLVMTSEKSDKSFVSTFTQDLEDIEHFSMIELDPLTPHQTFLQVKSILGTEYDIKDIGRFVYEKTEGNPFLIERFAQTLAENLCLKKIGDKWELIPENAKKLRIPKGVTQFVEASLQKLSKEEFRVLEIATILKDNLNLHFLLGISGGTVLRAPTFQILNTLIWKGIITETQSGKYTFTHKIVADLIENKTSPLKTLSLHKKASKVLEKKFKQNLEEVAGDIARHYLKGGEKRKAYHFAMIAGEKAKRAYANEEAIRQFEIALLLINEVGNKKKKFALLETVGDLYQLMGDYKKAILNYENALSLKQSERIYRKIGKVYREQGNRNKEIEFLVKGLEIVKSENLYEKILLLTDIGWAYGQLNRHKEAMLHSLNAVNLAKKENNQDGLAYAYNTLGSLYYQTAEWEKAIKYYKGELNIGEKISNEQHIAFSSCSLGLIYWKMGKWQLAEKFYKKSLQITEKKGDIHRTLDNYTALGILAQETNNLKKALDYHNKAFDISRKIGNRDEIAHCYINLGRVYQAIGNWTKALQNYENGLSTSKKIKNNVLIIICYLNLGDLYRVKGNYEKAIKNFKQSLNIATEIDDEEKIAYTCRSVGEVLQDKGKWKASLEFLVKSIKIYEKIRLKKERAEVSRILANTYVNI
ncbi:tetratricopeptide repeat protein, partial [candidate division WOR-3 bacterium]|nr:tetratricopeptide repeat protein [candidate division WOR-3 bacterium]